MSGTILEEVNKKIKAVVPKQQPTKSPKSQQHSIPIPKPATNSTGLNMLSKRLHLTLKDEPKNQALISEVNSWLASLNAAEISFSETEQPWISQWKSLDLEKFTTEFLKKEVIRSDLHKEDKEEDLGLDGSWEENQDEEFKWVYNKPSRRSYLRHGNSIFELISQKDFTLEEGVISLVGREEDPEEPEPVYSNLLRNGFDLVCLDPNGDNADDFIDSVLLHFLEKTRDLIDVRKKNRDRSDEELENCLGYVKPSLLILASYRYECLDIISKICELYGSKIKKDLSEKLESTYGSEDKAMIDKFCLSIGLGKSLRISKNVYAGDIVIASPSALLEADFSLTSAFSSLVSLFIFKAENFQMQNMEHLDSVLSQLCQIPAHKDVTEDFRCIHPAFVERKGAFFLQSAMLTSYYSAEILSLTSRFFKSHQGCLRQKMFHPLADLPLSFTFKKAHVSSITMEFEEKLNYFENRLWPHFRESSAWEGSIIVVNNYLQYLKLKELLKRKHAPVGFISEHTGKPKVQSTLTKFKAEKFLYLLITERALFFEVVKPKSFKGIFFYGMVHNLSVIENLAQGKKNLPAMVYFSRKDFYELEGVFGTSKATEFVRDENKFKEFTL